MAESGLPESAHLFPAAHVPAFLGSPAADSLAVTYAWVVMGFILALAVLTRMAMELKPVGVQNFLEWLIEMIEAQAKSILGEATARFLPLFVALFLFILFSNLIGLIPGCMSPTASYHTNLAMALVVFVVSQYAGITAHGFKGYLKHYLPPPAPGWIRWTLLIVMIPPLHVLEQLIRPVSLTMRLFGNIFAKEILLVMLAFVTASFFASPTMFVKGLAALPFILRPGIILLGTLVSIVQAAVFTILAMVYVALAMEHEAEEGHGDAHGPAHA